MKKDRGMKQYVWILVSMLVLSVVGTSCGGTGDELAVSEVWSRASASMQNAGAVYMNIAGGESSDRLIAVAVDESVAMKAEIHETTMAEGDDGQEMMAMQQVSSIEVPADGQAVLEPGGYHIMLMQLVEPLVDGGEFTVTLTFEEAGDIEVVAEVRTG